MKNYLLIGIALLFSMNIKAQSTDEITLIQSIWGMEKKAIMEEHMNLSPGESTAFWAEYEVYEAARKELGKERIEIITAYVENYVSLSGEMATELMNSAINNNIALQKLTKNTFKNMSKVISPVKAAQFIQLENYLSLMIQMQIQDDLPFIGELEEMIDE